MNFQWLIQHNKYQVNVGYCRGVVVLTRVLKMRCFILIVQESTNCVSLLKTNLSCGIDPYPEHENHGLEFIGWLLIVGSLLFVTLNVPRATLNLPVLYNLSSGVYRMSKSVVSVKCLKCKQGFANTRDRKNHILSTEHHCLSVLCPFD